MGDRPRQFTQENMPYLTPEEREKLRKLAQEGALDITVQRRPIKKRTEQDLTERTWGITD